jgi:Mrp family chromosome partitioning ATPase
MARLAEEMACRYENRFILFDCPPLLATTEAAALTAHAGQVLLVVQAEATKEVTVRHALALIDEKPEVGIVLNRTRLRIGSTEIGDYYNTYDANYGYGRQKPG